MTNPLWNYEIKQTFPFCHVLMTIIWNRFLNLWINYTGTDQAGNVFIKINENGYSQKEES